MKYRNSRNLALVLTLGLLFSLGCTTYDGPRPTPRYGPELRIEVFYDALSPYGEWILLDAYGWVWIPRGVGATWRPYTQGRWIYTDYGWTWSSSWTWGWAPFHYGRWTRHSHHGWIWIPGRYWAPAWVAWRAGDGWFGWAPLPHDLRWRAEIGLELGAVDLGVAIATDHWVFVNDRYLLDRRLKSRLVPPARNRMLLQTTRDATRYRSEGRWVAEHGVAVGRVEEILRQEVPRRRIEDLTQPLTRRRSPTAVDRLRVYRPKVSDAPATRAPSQRTVKKKKGG